jgi:hypothetical protein
LFSPRTPNFSQRTRTPIKRDPPNKTAPGAKIKMLITNPISMIKPSKVILSITSAAYALITFPVFGNTDVTTSLATITYFTALLIVSYIYPRTTSDAQYNKK